MVHDVARPVLETIPVRRLFGLAVHAATMEQAAQACEQAIASGQPLVVGVVNAAKIANLRRDTALRSAVTSCDLLLADGQSVVWASRLLRQRLPERVAGIDLFTELLARANTAGQRVFFLGATQEVLDQLVAKVRTELPGLQVAGAQHGYFTSEQAPAVAAAIRASHTDLLFVGMSSPHKEVFLDTWGPSLDVRVCHGVGGSFDVLAGKTRRAPGVVQRLGLEWLYRIWQEPARLWKRYLTTNTRFLVLTVAEMVRPTPPYAVVTPAVPAVPVVPVQRTGDDLVEEGASA